MTENEKSICSAISVYDTLSTKTPFSCSADDKIAILCSKHICILTLSCQPNSTDSHYSIVQERIECPKMDNVPPVNLNESLLQTSNDVPQIGFDPIMKYNARSTFLYSPYTSEGFGIKEGFRTAEWSPLFVDTNTNCILAALGHDSRLILFHQTINLDSWSQIAELHQLYYYYYLRYGRLVYHEEPPRKLSYYQLTGLKNEDEVSVWCDSVEEYMTALQDLTFSTISWSKIIRDYRHDEELMSFSLLVCLTKSGTLVFWNMKVPFIHENCCSLAYVDTTFTSEELHDHTLMKVCDINSQLFMVALSMPDGSIKMIFYEVKFDPQLGQPIIDFQMKHPVVVTELKQDLCFCNLIEWTQATMQLIVAKEATLYVLQVEIILKNEEYTFSFHVKSVGIVDAENNKGITGLQCRRSDVYASTEDGYILKCSIKPEGVMFQNLYSPTRKSLDKYDYCGVFVSANGVLLGLLENPCTFLESSRSARQKEIVPRMLIMSKWGDDDLLELLLNEQMPFHEKHDAVEELRRRYVCNRDLMKDDLMQLVETEETWSKFNKHHLQFMKYLCQFHGQNFKENRADLPTSPHQIRLNEKINKLDILLLKHHLTDLFCKFKQENIARTPEDATIVLRIINIVTNVNEPLLKELKSLMEVCHSFATKLLKTSFIPRTVCSVCNLDVAQNLFTASCPGQRHTFQRCCQTLVACDSYNYRYCRNCNVQAMIVPENCSEWRRKVCSRYCPFCDGDLVVKF